MREGWEYKKLGEVCNILNGYAFKSSKYTNSGTRIIRITNVQKGYVIDNDPKYYSDDDIKNLTQYSLREGDLVMSLTGNVGRVGMLQKSMLPAALNQRVACIRTKSDEISLNYLFHLFNSDVFERAAIRSARGIAQLNMSTEWLKEHTIPLPPKSTQLAIVSELDKINELIRLKKEQLKDFDNLAQSIFYEMFGDPVENEKGWETKRLGDVCIYPANRLPISEIKPQNYVGVENLQKNRAGIIFSEKIPNINSATEFILNDILIGNIRPYLKKIWIANKNGGASGDVVIVRITSGLLLPMYLFKVLASDQFFEYDNTYTKGAKMPRGDRKAISNFPIPLPPLHLQHLFAHRIEQIEHQKAEVQKAIADLETLLASRMQYWFE